MPELEFQPPNLHDVIAYRGVYVLGTTRVSKEDKRPRLTASHYCSCLVFGKNPMWAVWTAAGKFLRFYNFKSQIADAYPKLVWRRKMAQWSLIAVDDLRPPARRALLADRYKSEVPS